MVELIYFCIMWIDGIPNKNEISGEYSPKEFVEHQCLDYRKHCWTLFGSTAKFLKIKTKQTQRQAKQQRQSTSGQHTTSKGHKKFCLTMG